MIVAPWVGPILRVFVSGLVVFATNNPKQPSDLQTILLNATDTPVATDGCPIPRHRPLLLHNQACKFPCRPERGLCACPLDRSLVQFWSVDASGVRTPLGPQKKKGEFTSLDKYVARAQSGLFQVFNQGDAKRIRHDCWIPHGSYPPGKLIPICPLVAAQVDFAPDGFYACELMSGSHTLDPIVGDVCNQKKEKSKNAIMNGNNIKFSPLSKESWGWFDQPLTTREVLERSTPGLYELVAEVRSFDGMLDYEVRLETMPCGACWLNTQLCVDLAIVNQPEQGQLKANGYERCGEMHVDREFELFEDLLEGAREIESRRVPQASHFGKAVQGHRSEWCESNLIYSLDRWFRTGGERKQCPPLSAAAGN